MFNGLTSFRQKSPTSLQCKLIQSSSEMGCKGLYSPMLQVEASVFE